MLGNLPPHGRRPRKRPAGNHPPQQDARGSAQGPDGLGSLMANLIGFAIVMQQMQERDLDDDDDADPFDDLATGMAAGQFGGPLSPRPRIPNNPRGT